MRCQTAACSVYAQAPYARYKQGATYFCWGCFVALYPDKAKLKIRKEHYVLAELDRLLPTLSAFQSVWDCPVPGGCSLKRPDKLYVMHDRYIQIEVDEFGHNGNACFDEDTRLEIIAADVGLPGYVIRIDPDNPACFRHKRLVNGEAVEVVIDAPFNTLMSKTVQVVETCMRGPAPDSVERVFVVI